MQKNLHDGAFLSEWGVFRGIFKIQLLFFLTIYFGRKDYIFRHRICFVENLRIFKNQNREIFCVRITHEEVFSILENIVK